MTKLSGPFKLLTNKQQPDKLVVFLHGVGSDGHDLIGLATDIATAIPNAIFLSPNAPFPYDAYSMGYQWFSLSDYSPDKLYQGIKIALPILKDYIDENLAKFNLSYKDLVLIGFSQGTMMALQLAPRLAEACFAVIGFSGALVNPTALEQEIIAKPPICLIHGDDDQVVPLTRHRLTVQALNALDIPLKEYVIKDMGHSINNQALNLAINFLKEQL